MSEKLKLCVVCGMEIEGNTRVLGNARKTCSIACREKRYEEKEKSWMKKNCEKMKAYYKKYALKRRKTKVRSSYASAWAPIHSYDVLSD